MSSKNTSNGGGARKRPAPLPKPTTDQLIERFSSHTRERDQRELAKLMRDNRAPFL